VGIFLKLHHLSKKLNYTQIVAGILIGAAIQAAGSDYAADGSIEVDALQNTAINETLGAVTINSTDTPLDSGPTYREIALQPEQYEGQTVTTTGTLDVATGLKPVLENQQGLRIEFKCDKYAEEFNTDLGTEITVTGEVRDLDRGYTVVCTEPFR